MFFNELDFYLRSFLKLSRRNFSPELKINMEAIYVKTLLQKFLSGETFKSNLKILDIGSKNWCYVKGEWEFFNEKSREIILTGIEIDAYRLNSKFYSRCEIAKGYIKDLKNTVYIAGDLLKHSDKYDVIIWILPFVVYEPHKAWGLPLKYFAPEKMLSHAFNLLNSDGILLIVNQESEEFEAQKRLFNNLKINFEDKGEFLEKPFRKTRFVSIVRKKDN